MDSIVKSEAGFKDGVFLNSQTSLLPWPSAARGNSRYDTVKVSNGTRISTVMPNPYDPLKGGVAINDFNIIYYNDDNTIRFSVNVSDIANNSAGYFAFGHIDQHVIVLVDNVPYLLGQLKRNADNRYYLFRVNLNNGTGEIGTESFYSTNLAFNVERFGILEDGSVFACYRNQTNDTSHSCLIDPVALKKGADLAEVGYSNKVLESGRPKFGVALFNGSVSMIEAGVYGINPDLDFTSSKNNKQDIYTRHVDAINKFRNIYQLSKDMFMATSDESSSILYLERSLLQQWVSDCIYATYNFRIPTNY